jgi:hypothetical protein
VRPDDALVHDGWLGFLRERMKSGPHAGAVTPRLLNFGWTLQEPALVGALAAADIPAHPADCVLRSERVP